MVFVPTRFLEEIPWFRASRSEAVTTVSAGDLKGTSRYRAYPWYLDDAVDPLISGQASKQVEESHDGSCMGGLSGTRPTRVAVFF
jgi:hypothetical protein